MNDEFLMSNDETGRVSRLASGVWARGGVVWPICQSRREDGADSSRSAGLLRTERRWRVGWCVASPNTMNYDDLRRYSMIFDGKIKK
jgi:hypothetical protein